MPDYGYVGEGLVVNDAPIYQWIVFDLARRHPEWHLGSRDAKELQRQYAALCEAKFRLEGRLAMVTRVSALENRVEIPAFQDQQETLFAGLGQYIDQRFGPDPGMSIAQEMKKLFEGTDGASGAYALTLHIRLENQPGYKYKVVREFAFENGTGMGTDYLRADRLGSLAFNPRFLPTGK